MEILSIIINYQVDKKLLNPVRFKDIGISHLLYANDVLLFAKTNTKSVKANYSTLKEFMALSGMSINLGKSSIWFSPNTPNSSKVLACSTLGIRETPKPGSYLDLPLGITSKKKDFDCVLHKIQSRISSWKGKYLFPMGKAVLIRSVCSAILAFFMQCLPLPKGVCEEIDRKFRNFFWESLGSK